jgi:uncharacterized lipoprotein YajG
MAIDDLKESLGIDDDDFKGIKDGVHALDKSTSKFRKGIKGAKSVVKAAKGNIFEFPVFISSSVPLDYATATSSLLEQVYASFLQMAISANPVITSKSAANGTQFAHLKSDTNKYLECVDTSYQADACYNRIGLGYTMKGEEFLEFSLINIDDGEARVINEQCDYQPLSEFDHFFTEANAPERRMATGGHPGQMSGTITPDYLGRDRNGNVVGMSYAAAEEMFYTIESLRRQVEDRDNERANKAQAAGSLGMNVDADAYDTSELLQKLDKLISDSKKSAADAKRAAHEAQDKILDQEDRIRDLDENIKQGQKDRAPEELAKLKAERKLAEKKLKDYKKDHQAQQAKIKAETDKLNAEVKNIADKYNLDLKAAERDAAKEARESEKYEYEKSRRRSDEMDAANRGRIRAPQFMDETKIQKLNTMKPLMMTVDLNVEGKDGRIVQGVEYIVGVKTHNRLVDASTLPEVVEYPLKEMNKITRKAKWRAGELKFFKDILFKIPQKKQTAIDSRDPKRKWYRRLYELAHIKGDAPAKAIINGESVIKVFFKDKFGKYGDTSGVIPNATLVISKADVDIIKRETKIDMLKGSTAAKFCKELFMIAIVVIDNDAESIKILMPDLHSDYEVHSLGSVNKQLALLDTSGTKTRDMFKLLG